MLDTLQGSFPSEFKLVAHLETRAISLLCISSSSILAQKRLTKNEWTLFIVLVENYPHYAPYEMLLASLTTLSLDTCRIRLHEAQESGTEAVKQELKPVHRALSSLRAKLKSIYPQLKISVVRDAGYGLTISPASSKETV